MVGLQFLCSINLLELVCLLLKYLALSLPLAYSDRAISFSGTSSIVTCPTHAGSIQLQCYKQL